MAECQKNLETCKFDVFETDCETNLLIDVSRIHVQSVHLTWQYMYTN